jgi:hypothetical protein
MYLKLQMTLILHMKYMTKIYVLGHKTIRGNRSAIASKSFYSK